MLLDNKTAVVYGAAGAIGSTVARAFAREGARVFLTGRRRAPLEALAREIVAAGGRAEAAEVDALDEAAIARHLGAVADQAGRLDISFNAVGLTGATTLGVPLTELDAERYLQPVRDYALSWFLTARSAARLMLPSRAGVLMTVTALPARAGTPLNGGYGSAQAAKEALTRDLSCELASHGLRVVGLRPHGMVETPTMRKVYESKAATMGGISWEQFGAYLANMSHAKRSMRLDDVGGVAAFMASDRASGMTGTSVNLTMGSLDD